MRSLQLELRALFRSSPRIVLVASILIFLVTNKFIALRFAGYFITAELLSSLLKTIVGKTMPNNLEIKRPVGGGGCMGCSTMFRCENSCINVSEQIGMPSGHSLTIAMAATFWILWIWNTTATLKSKLFRSILLCLSALAVILSRTSILEGCHTYLQVIIGTILGVSIGFGFYYLDQNILKITK